MSYPFFSEDTCLCFDAFGADLPGPYIKYFQNQLGPEGLLKMLVGFDNYKATAVTTIAYCEDELAEPMIFQGETIGKMVAPRGNQVFGFDQAFQPDGFTET